MQVLFECCESPNYARCARESDGHQLGCGRESHCPQPGQWFRKSTPARSAISTNKHEVRVSSSYPLKSPEQFLCPLQLLPAQSTGLKTPGTKYLVPTKTSKPEVIIFQECDRECGGFAYSTSRVHPPRRSPLTQGPDGQGLTVTRPSASRGIQLRSGV
jgi:hypothetical protein